MGPFHEFKVSLVPAPLQMFFAEAGVVAYWRLSHCWPPQGLSHTQLPEEHTPFSEQSVLVVQVAAAATTRHARSANDGIAKDTIRLLPSAWPGAGGYIF